MTKYVSASELTPYKTLFDKAITMNNVKTTNDIPSFFIVFMVFSSVLLHITFIIAFFNFFFNIFRNL